SFRCRTTSTEVHKIMNAVRPLEADGEPRPPPVLPTGCAIPNDGSQNLGYPRQCFLPRSDQQRRRCKWRVIQVNRTDLAAPDRRTEVSTPGGAVGLYSLSSR